MLNIAGFLAAERLQPDDLRHALAHIAEMGERHGLPAH
jgi:hypothetical protein